MSDLHWSGVVIDSTDPQRLGRFYAEVLGYKIVEDSPGWCMLQNPDGSQPFLTCQSINAHVQHGAKTPQGNRFHLDLGEAPGDQRTDRLVKAQLDRLERLGARQVDRIDVPGQAVHWILADPEGNVFCTPGI